MTVSEHRNRIPQKPYKNTNIISAIYSIGTIYCRQKQYSSVYKLFFTLSIGIAQADSIRFESKISEERFILINGIEQWITIKEERSKPAILFLHGGPGSPLSPYSVNIYKDWEKDFIIVHWDQRGTGKTFEKQVSEELTSDYLKKNPLTINTMPDNGMELSEYLLKYLGKQKSYFSVLRGGRYLG